MSIDLSSAQWIKSSYSESGGQCVEVAFLANDAVGVRDSKDPHGPALVFSAGEWATFLSAVDS
ncbi:DUF397 domain-containing protein [Nocardia yamanashiensis]|uniref:DUF397 domain-containing protein n=1 Tax=Nocardia yamanashiensis TaxID=209247 RepID=UPI001E2D55FE|nr:DUF397 domain-containing protein [Nocardia yamanashiensis]UGT45326.1 DUF397 domain-containing protein [Nocardia yamanashiensis]